VAADGLVGATPDQDERAHTDVSEPQIVVGTERHTQESQGREENHRLSRQCAGSETWQQADVVGICALASRQCPRHYARIADGVGVEKQQPLTRRVLRPDLAGVAFADPPPRQCLHVHDDELWMSSRDPVEHLRGAVLGSVVDDHQLQSHATLTEQTLNGRLDPVHLVTDRDDNRHRGAIECIPARS